MVLQKSIILSISSIKFLCPHKSNLHIGNEHQRPKNWQDVEDVEELFCDSRDGMLVGVINIFVIRVLLTARTTPELVPSSSGGHRLCTTHGERNSTWPKWRKLVR